MPRTHVSVRSRRHTARRFGVARAAWFFLGSCLPASLPREGEALDACAGNYFADRLSVDVFDPLIREFRVAFAGFDGGMPQEFLDRDHLSPRFQEVGGKCMPQAVTAGLDASRLGFQKTKSSGTTAGRRARQVRSAVSASADR